ncbi:MAG: hypothetical protein VYE68_10760 [Acidobacteriota bacterium]|nr:hypothetical protein [Acidobacteriota bacterium]
MRTPLVSLICLIAMTAGCQNETLSELTDDAQVALDGARTRAQELGELSAEELRDVWAIEYRTVEIAVDDLAALDEELNGLGQERWNCYHVSERDGGRVFYLKRTKSTALSNLSNLLRLGSIAF